MRSKKLNEAATGEWLFYRCGCTFKPDVLRRAVTLAKRRTWTIYRSCATWRWWILEKALITFFVAIFHLATNPRMVGSHRSPFYVGIGAFQLMKRSAYEPVGRIAGWRWKYRRYETRKIDQASGFRSGSAFSQDSVLSAGTPESELTRGVTKIFFAGFGYNMGLLRWDLSSPSAQHSRRSSGSYSATGGSHSCCHCLGYALGFYGGAAASIARVAIFALTYPLGSILLSYMLLRSAVVTLKQGGIVCVTRFIAG